MDRLNQLLLVLHFLGLAMGLSVSFSSMVMAGLIDKAAPAERPVLGRFPFAMSRVGDIGLTLLIISGVGLLFLKWGGFSAMPVTFHIKLALVVVLIGLVGYMHSLQKKMRNGDASAAARIQVVGKFAFLTALAIVVFAVLSFD
jgi:uncharacterized membrane protein SirB2